MRDWYAGLREEMTTEIRRSVKRLHKAGKDGWGNGSRPVKSRRKAGQKPTFPMFARDDEKGGRSLAYHAEVASEMITRHELGMSLWSDEPADTESFEGVELTQSESEMMMKLFESVNTTSATSLKI